MTNLCFRLLDLDLGVIRYFPPKLSGVEGKERNAKHQAKRGHCGLAALIENKAFQILWLVLSLTTSSKVSQVLSFPSSEVFLISMRHPSRILEFLTLCLLSALYGLAFLDFDEELIEVGWTGCG